MGNILEKMKKGALLVALWLALLAVLLPLIVAALALALPLVGLVVTGALYMRGWKK